MAKAKAKDTKDKDKGKAEKKARPSVPASPVITAEDPGPQIGEVPAADTLAPQRFIDRLTGARLCYGKPVTGGDVTIVPVARVRVAGGFGTGGEGDGGGGGAVQAAPIGYIEVGPDGSRFRAIDDADRTLAAVRSVAVTVAALLGAAAALRTLAAPRR
jgi:hypothetical protein